MNTLRPILIVCCLPLLAVTLVGCEEEQVGMRVVTRDDKRPRPRLPEPKWDLPAGWSRSQGSTEMRYVTLTTGGDQPVEVSISSLARDGGGHMANINRWRRQIGLPPASEAQLGGFAERIDGPSVAALLVDMTKTDSTQRTLAAIFHDGFNTWFAKASDRPQRIETIKDDFVALVKSFRFKGASRPRPAAARPAAPTPPTWSAPADWQTDAAPAQFAVASFTVTEGEQSARVTISPLPPAAANLLLSNINRWRGQVGLPPVTSVEEQAPVKLDIAGQPAGLLDLSSEQGDPNRPRILVAIVPKPDFTWYFKLTGPHSLAEKQKQAFVTFLKSVEFPESTD